MNILNFYISEIRISTLYISEQNLIQPLSHYNNTNHYKHTQFKSNIDTKTYTTKHIKNFTFRLFVNRFDFNSLKLTNFPANNRPSNLRFINFTTA